MNLDQIRGSFPILQRRNYLNSCSLGALCTRAEDQLADFVKRWHDLGASAWYEHWWGRLGELRGAGRDALRFPERDDRAHALHLRLPGRDLVQHELDEAQPHRHDRAGLPLVGTPLLHTPRTLP